MKKDKETGKRRLILSRETLQNLEDSRLREQVRGGTSQWGCFTTTQTNYNEISNDGC